MYYCMCKIINISLKTISDLAKKQKSYNFMFVCYVRMTAEMMKEGACLTLFSDMKTWILKSLL